MNTVRSERTCYYCGEVYMRHEGKGRGDYYCSEDCYQRANKAVRKDLCGNDGLIGWRVGNGLDGCTYWKRGKCMRGENICPYPTSNGVENHRRTVYV